MKSTILVLTALSILTISSCLTNTPAQAQYFPENQAMIDPTSPTGYGNVHVITLEQLHADPDHINWHRMYLRCLDEASNFFAPALFDFWSDRSGRIAYTCFTFATANGGQEEIIIPVLYDNL